MVSLNYIGNCYSGEQLPKNKKEKGVKQLSHEQQTEKIINQNYYFSHLLRAALSDLRGAYSRRDAKDCFDRAFPGSISYSRI